MGRSTVTKEEFELLQKLFYESLYISEEEFNEPGYLENRIAEDFHFIKEDSEKDENAKHISDMLGLVVKGMSSPEAFTEVFGKNGSFQNFTEAFDKYASTTLKYSPGLSSAMITLSKIIHFNERVKMNVFDDEASEEIDEYFIEYESGSITDDASTDEVFAAHRLRCRQTEHITNMLPRYNQHVSINAMNEGLDSGTIDSLTVKLEGIKANPSNNEKFREELFEYIRKNGVNKINDLVYASKQKAKDFDANSDFTSYYYVPTDINYYNLTDVKPPTMPSMLSEKEIARRQEEKMGRANKVADNLTAAIRNYNERVRILGANALLDDKQIEDFLIKLPKVTAKEDSEEFRKQVFHYVLTENKKDFPAFFDALFTANNRIENYKAETGIDLSAGEDDKFFDRESFDKYDLSNENPMPELPQKLPEQEIERIKQERATASNSFAQIKAERNKKAEYDQAFEDAAVEYSKKTNRYDQHRFDGKKSIDGMSTVYRLWFPKDKQLMPILDAMDELSMMDVTSDDGLWGYRAEGKLIISIEEKINKLSDDLEKEEEALHQETIKYFRKDDPQNPGGFIWAEEDPIDHKYYFNFADIKIEADPHAKEKDEELKKKVADIDKKRALVTALGSFISTRRNGALIDDPEAPHIKVKTSDFEDTFIKTDAAKGKPKYIRGKSFKLDYSDRPLFPHDPSGDDIKQGAFGDCYFVQTLSDIARTHPEKIREAMVDNEDGTVTVRLFSKDENKQLKPIYVTVEKKVPSYLVKDITAENCIWAACFEMALAASGIYNGNFQPPVPMDKIEEINNEYKELKRLEKNGQLTQERKNTSKAQYPWLFKGIYDDKTQSVVEYIVKWPSLNYIIGGFGISAGEIVLGDSIKRIHLEGNDLFQERKDINDFIAATPKTVEQMCAIILADKTRSLISQNPKEDLAAKKGLDLSLPKEELFEAAFKLSKMPKAQKAALKQEFEDNIKKLSNELKRQGKIAERLSKGEFAEIAGRVFSEQTGTGVYQKYASTLNALHAERDLELQKEAQIKLFNQIDKCLQHNLPVGFGTTENSKKIPLPAHHEYGVLGVFIDDLGNRMIRLRNPWASSSFTDTGVKLTIHDDGTRTYSACHADHGESVMEFSDWLKCANRIYMPDVEAYLNKNPEKEVDPKEKLIQGNNVDPKTMFSYIGAIDNICKAFVKTEHWYRSSTEEYINLRNAVKDIRATLLEMNGKPVSDFKKHINDLSETISSYEQYCKDHPTKNNSRRDTRVAITEDLKQILEAVNAGYRSPMEYKKDCYITKEIPDNIQELSSGIKEAFSNNNAEVFISCIAAKIYLTDLLDSASKLPAQKIDAMMKPAEIQKNIDKFSPRIATVLAGMEPADVYMRIEDGSICQEISKKMSEQFTIKSEVNAAEKKFKENKKTVTSGMNKENMSKGWEIV